MITTPRHLRITAALVPGLAVVAALAVVVTLAFVAVRPAAADEGMWMLTQLPKLRLTGKGLRIKPTAIVDRDGHGLTRACVNLSGASGAFVSDRGLVLTNHHVAFRGIQQVSSPEQNFVRDGFLARTLEEEKPLPGYTATVTLGCRDVTRRVLKGLAPDASMRDRQRHVNGRIDAILGEARRKSKDSDERFRVKEVLYGGAYVLYTLKTYRDVRLVCAPPAAIGEFGGDTDNWMWPRHTGDFSYLRVYAGPGGKPARRKAENVPLRPERWLEVSTDGVKEGDFTFILGHPARTSRHVSSYSLSYQRDVALPRSVQGLETMASRARRAGEKDEAARLKNMSRLKGVLNSLKNYRGKLEWIDRNHVVESVVAEEKALTAFLDKRGGALEKRYGGVLKRLEEGWMKIRHGGRVRGRVDRVLRCKVVRAALAVHQLSVEKPKADEQRKAAYRENRLERTGKRAARRLADLDLAVEAKAFVTAVRGCADLPDRLTPAPLAALVRGKQGDARGAALEAFAARVWKDSRLKSAKEVTRWFKMDAAGLAKLDDPMVKLAAGLSAARGRTNTGRGGGSRLKEPRRLLVEARRAWKSGRPVAPDADGTLRFTFGKVRGYRPRDGVRYLPLTSLAGVVEKETGKAPFRSPPRLLELYRQRDFGQWVDKRLGCVPVAFVHDTDITGGNSGSPVLDARGKMIGIAFDGNWEAITNDYRFDSGLTRTISVDIRYVLFYTEKFVGANHLLEEMGVKERSL